MSYKAGGFLEYNKDCTDHGPWPGLAASEAECMDELICDLDIFVRDRLAFNV